MIQFTDVTSPVGLGGINDQFASDLGKIVVTFEEYGPQPDELKIRKLHLVVKSALQSSAA